MKEGSDFFRTVEILRSNPIVHLETVQGVSLESYQKRILKAVCEFERVSVAACHDVGKTFLAARIVLWFGSVFPHSKIITTAPTFTQVKSLLWSEIRAGFESSKYPLGGQMLQTEWQIDADWFALGLTSKSEASGGKGQGLASSFQGFHAPYILVVFDEATGISPSIWKQVEGILTSGFIRFLCIGNPTSKVSPFFNTFSRPGVKKFHITCFESPNLRVNGIVDMPSLLNEVNSIRALNDEDAENQLRSYKVVRPYLLSARWVIERAIEWGVDHPLFLSKVLAQFPDEDDNSWFGLGIVEDSMYRESKSMDKTLFIGVDVARFGADKSVITSIQADRVNKPKVLLKKDGPEVAGEVIAFINSNSETLQYGAVIAIDGTGVGASVVDTLNQYQLSNREWKRIQIVEVNFGEGFKKEPEYLREELEKKYVNRKAQIFHQLSLDLKSTLTLPEENVYLLELPTIVYRFNAKGQFFMETKDEYKKRTGRGSPDHSDSLALANFARSRHNRFGGGDSILPVVSIKPISDGLNSRVRW